MLRFPNPGSTTSNFVEVYKAVFGQCDGQVFNLDQIVAAIVDANLATSSGYMGAEAISRSTRNDRSRDPFFNQAKMYAELLRALGWIHPSEQRALNFTFTLLGRQVVASDQHYLGLLGETVLGISYPSHVLSTKGGHVQRPIAFLLRTMVACDNALSRDEMIVGPLSTPSDLSSNAVSDLVAQVNRLREERKNVVAALAKVAGNQKVQVNTLINYTRWPIAVMRDLGWTEKVRFPFRKGGKSFEVHQLTETGRKVAEWVSTSADLRLDQVEKLPPEEKAAISIYAHCRMLERAGFDLGSVNQKLEAQELAFHRALTLLQVPLDRPLLFSPFQGLSLADIAQIFPSPQTSVSMDEGECTVGGTVMGRGSRDHLFVEPSFVPLSHDFGNGQTCELREELRAIREVHQSAEEAAAAFAQSKELYTQTEFYPLICKLFRLLGFDSENSRAGVNYQRWDGWVKLDETVAPMEIKSPAEEKVISTKAVRQAVENKVVLLARGGLDTSIDTTTLVVGYQIPNERGELSLLIDDVFYAFKISIGVIDLGTLALLAIRAVTEDLTVQSDQLSTLRGFLHV